NGTPPRERRRRSHVGLPSRALVARNGTSIRHRGIHLPSNLSRPPRSPTGFQVSNLVGSSESQGHAQVGIAKEGFSDPNLGVVRQTRCTSDRALVASWL